MSYYKDQLKEWLGNKDFDGGKVLSVGCENDDRKYFRSFKCAEYTTMDISEKFKPDFFADVNNKLLSDQRFDCVFSFELWDYIWNPIMALQNFREILYLGGSLWISAPFIYPMHSDADPDFLRYTTHFWNKVLPICGFEIIQYERRYLKNVEGFIRTVSEDGIRLSDYKHHNVSGHLIIAKKIG